MSDMKRVDRFWCNEASNIRCVRESDYDALAAELARLKTIPMKYRRMEFNARLQNENDALVAENTNLKADLRNAFDVDLQMKCLRDQESEINNLTARVAELQALKAEHQWIPVGERLPKSDTEPVWCHGTYEGQYAPCGFEGIYRLGRWVCLNNGDYIDGGYGDDYEAVVTHWMPLPAAPEDKSHD